ncbi:MAG: NUDIX hydrolase [Candidatus Nomurabacteria bacterium]|jgi:ADP-ribose pyrophosphatase YjhB (NUDIX family)|nr:NUDIX hydrolase [Candidatus Nomurabacteria bacterium]
MRNFVPKNAHLVPPQAKLAFRGQIFDIYQWQQKMFDGSYATFEMAKRPDTVNVIVIRDDKIVVISDEQPGRAAKLSLPGGRHDHDDETELDAAQRELAEETGLIFRNWKLVDVYEPIKDTNKLEWMIYVFVATDFEAETNQQLDAGEKIDVRYLTYDDMVALIDSGEAGYLASLRDLLAKAGSIEGLKNLPEMV